MSEIFQSLESGVRSYCRSFPAVFDRAVGAYMWDNAGRAYIDLFAGAGALNYGHNPQALREDLVAYLRETGITHGLDMHTRAKAAFLEVFDRHILRPRGLAYRLMFPGPTGTNAVEAALKLARKVTGRKNVAAFTNGFHGMTLGALAGTGSASSRAAAGLPLSGVDRLPFDRFFGEGLDTVSMIERLLSDPSSGIDPPAGFLVETVQGEGGINAASAEWLRRLGRLAERHGSLLIVDDVQAGCGRTGPFFSFEEAGLTPDIVCLSKSLSGYGLPFSMVLLRPDLDIWKPGEHNGTFRGHNLAFVTARSAVLNYWSDNRLVEQTKQLAADLDMWLHETADRFGLPAGAVRGRGLMRGLAMPDGKTATQVSAEAFRRGVVIETSGGRGEVVKFLPPLVIAPDLLRDAVDRVGEAVGAALDSARRMVPAAE